MGRATDIILEILSYPVSIAILPMLFIWLLPCIIFNIPATIDMGNAVGPLEERK